jgi:osmoprotectant transport system permease protein
MSSDLQQTQRPPNLLRELIDGWLYVLTKPGKDTYFTQLPKASALKTVLVVGILAVFASLYAVAVGESNLIYDPNNIILSIVKIILLVEIVFFSANLLVYLALKAMGGKGIFSEQSYLASLLVTPLGLIILAFLLIGRQFGLTFEAAFNPLSASGVLGGLVVLVAIYGAASLLIALQAAHRVKASKAFYALVLLLVLWAGWRVAIMFAGRQETLITQIWSFIASQWRGGYLQIAFLGHFWLVTFSTVIATIIGVIMGVMITLPSSRPKPAHLVFALPMVIFFIIWAASAGLFGVETASTISDTVRTWDRSLRSINGLFGELFVILGAILRKPASIGVIGMVVTVGSYALLLAGEKASELTLYIAGIILTIPSIALFGVLIKPLGIGAFNAAFALILYAQLPILRNTYTGIREVQTEIVEAGRGMGMTEFQLLVQVKLPLAVPVIMTGLRVSIVMLIGIGAIAAYIGNDTLGEYIFAGIQRAQEVRYITGAIIIAALALVVDFILGLVQEHLTPEGLKGRRNTG